MLSLNLIFFYIWFLPLFINAFISMYSNIFGIKSLSFGKMSTYVKFKYSEKATKFEKKYPTCFDIY